MGEAGRGALAAAPAALRGTNIEAPELTDALPDTINLRVWDAGRPRWVSPFAGASSAAHGRPFVPAISGSWLLNNLGQLAP